MSATTTEDKDVPNRHTISVFLLADPHPRDTRVVIARLRSCALRPRIYMDMLDFSTTSGDRRGHEDMVDLLRVLVIHIRVTLCRRHAGDLVDVGQQPLERRKDAACLDELVHVATHDDTRIGVECKERSDESLKKRRISALRWMRGCGIYRGDVHLGSALLALPIHRRAGVTLWRRAEAFRIIVYVHCVETVARWSLPCCRERLTRFFPSDAGRIDAPRIEAGEDPAELKLN